MNIPSLNLLRNEPVGLRQGVEHLISWIVWKLQTDLVLYPGYKPGTGLNITINWSAEITGILKYRFEEAGWKVEQKESRNGQPYLIFFWKEDLDRILAEEQAERKRAAANAEKIRAMTDDAVGETARPAPTPAQDRGTPP